jgi:hypothetical protein
MTDCAYSQALTEYVLAREVLAWSWPEETDIAAVLKALFDCALGGTALWGVVTVLPDNGRMVSAVDLLDGERYDLQVYADTVDLYSDGAAPWHLVKRITRALRRAGLTPRLDYRDSETARKHGTTARWEPAVASARPRSRWGSYE